MLSRLLTRLGEEIEVEKQRYSRTRYGKIAAALFYYIAFATVPGVLNVIIPAMTQVMKEEYVYIVLSIATLASVFIIWNVVMMFVYKCKLPFFEQYRINPQKPWPWEQNYQDWKKLLFRSIYFTFMSIFVIGGLSLLFDINMDFRVVMDVNKRLDIQWILLQFFLMMLGQDIFFFTTHYILHQSPFYRIHKIHHQYTTSVSVAGLHFHYIQFMLTQSVSTLVSMRMAGLVGPLNISTLIVWLIFRMWDAFNAHCGYVFSWGPLQLLPFCTNDEYHDFHHTQNCGNYGSHFRFWDSVFDTNREFRKYKKEQLKKLNKNKVK